MAAVSAVRDAASRVVRSASGGTMKHLHKRALGNAGAAVAGAVIGGLIVVLLFVFCIVPVVRRYYRKWRAHRKGVPFKELDAEEGMRQSHPDDDDLHGVPQDIPRRLPSGESLKQLHHDSDDSNIHHAVVHDRLPLSEPSPPSPSKELSWSSSSHEGPLTTVASHDRIQPAQPDAFLTSYPDPTYSSHSHAQPAPRVDSKQGATTQRPTDPPQAYILRHTNEDYYDPTIPSEAFGMHPTDNRSRRDPNRQRSSSLKQHMKQMFGRKSSGQEGSTSSLASPTGSQVLPIKQITDDDLTESPTETSPPSIWPQVHDTASTTLRRGSSQASPIDPRHKTSPSPPTFPAPGTVNPMDIMPASTESELWHRTEHQLHISSLESPIQGPLSTNQADFQFAPVQSPPSLTEPGPADGLQASISPSPHTMSKDELAEQSDVVMIDTIPQHTSNVNSNAHHHLNPVSNSGSSRRPSNQSEHSTPFHGAPSTDASSHNTPSTLLDSPSPESMHSSDFRHSASPQLAQVVVCEKNSVFRCDVAGCNQFFDQPHKLKHHQRYHSKDHKCPYPACGKGFGTKTHLQRHINDRHEKKKKFHCAMAGCDYSRAGGKAFPRKDNWKRHMTKIHLMDQNSLPEPVEVDHDMSG